MKGYLFGTPDPTNPAAPKQVPGTLIASVECQQNSARPAPQIGAKQVPGTVIASAECQQNSARPAPQTGARHRDRQRRMPAKFSPTDHPNRCQAPGATPGRMLANRGPPNRCQAPGAEPGRMLANRLPKSVPGTRCSAGSDASKQGAQIGARHPV